VAEPLLVPHDPLLETSKPTNYSEDNQEILSHHMVCISEARHRSGIIDAATLDYLARSTRKGAHEAYNNGWKPDVKNKFLNKTHKNTIQPMF
jgi:hypothetical protein